jgi:hypothetical protein
MVRWYVRYKRLWAYYIDFILYSMCVLYGGFRSNSFVTKTQSFPMDSHYMMNIISGVGHLRLNSIVSLVLCMVVCNDWGTDIVLDIPWDSANFAKKG